MNNCIGALWVSGALALTGCQSSNPLSYWGNYENAAYASYKKPGDATPEVQIAKLKEDLEKAAAEARGGWKVLVFIAGAAGTCGSVLGWLVNHFMSKGASGTGQ